LFFKLYQWKQSQQKGPIEGYKVPTKGSRQV